MNSNNWVYDIEIVINCNTFIFIDAKTDKALIDAYVEADINKNTAEIAIALSKLEYRKFIIFNDTNELDKLIDFLRSDEVKILIGYNSHKYDDVILDYILQNSTILKTYSVDRIVNTLYNLSQDIIGFQQIGNYRKEYSIRYSKQYISIDLMRLHGLDKLRISLKQVSISLKWYRVEDYTPPEITDGEILKYGYTGTIEWYNRYVLPKHLEGLVFYNINDVLITYTLFNHSKDELANRIMTQQKYNSKVLSLSRSSTADVLMTHFYKESTGLEYWDFKDKRTYRRNIKFNDIIKPDIQFNTPQLKDFLFRLLQTEIKIGQDKFEEKLVFKNTGYKFAQGGLHSIDRPGVLVSTDNYTYIDADVSSYYPSIIIKYLIAPKHLSREAFVNILSFITKARIKAKKTGDTSLAAIYKIVINSVYGERLP